MWFTVGMKEQIKHSQTFFFFPSFFFSPQEKELIFLYKYVSLEYSSL